MFNAILGHLLKAEVALFHARLRLQASTDGEALHDLRIQLRRLRSLLRPLRGVDSADRLDRAVADVGVLTAPVRDLEVLVDELESKNHTELAATRRASLAQAYGQVLESPTLAMLFAELDEWPDSFRQDRLAGNLRKLRKKLTKQLSRQVRRLAKALADPAQDRHTLRIQAKHTRYMIEAYPKLSGVPEEVVCSLKTVLSALGTWHDLFQWCLRAATETDLQPLLPEWQRASASALRDAETEIIQLRHLLDG